jgi:hypothetical protein
MATSTKLKLGAGFALALAAALPGAPPDAQASDHDESPFLKTGAEYDITDVYVFDNAGATAIVVTWAGFTDDTAYTQPTTEGVFVPEVLYTINIDNSAPFDNVADIKIYWKYSQNEVDGVKGIQWQGIPDSAGDVVHAVEEVYTDDASGAQLWTGHADDPFFFDALGYLLTLDSAGLDAAGPNLEFGCLDPANMCAMNGGSSQDFLAGLNVTGAVVEIDHEKLGGGPIQVWATAGEKQ